MATRFTQTLQFQEGMAVEAFLDDLFRGRGYDIEKVSAREERIEHKGDRRFRRDGRCILIEYKSGIQTAYTGNVFLETVSVDKDNVPGWVYTSQADYIIYACVLNNVLLIFRPDDLRRKIIQLQMRFRTAKTRAVLNPGYHTHGVLVPLAVAEAELACKVIPISVDTNSKAKK